MFKYNITKLGCIGVSAILLILIGCGGSSNSSSKSAEFKVGRAAYDFVDASRVDPFLPESTKGRELSVFIWYPATPKKGAKPGPLIDSTLAEVLAGPFDVSPETIRKIPSNSYIDAEVSDHNSSYPVLLMSHGDGANPLFYSTTAEYLAARGFIVVGITHTYNANVTLFADGRLVGGLPEANVSTNLDGGGTELNFQASQASWNNGVKLSKIFQTDASFVLDQLARLNGEDPRMMGKMNLSVIGMFGHSFGGSHSFGVLRSDSRVSAAVDLDGTLFVDGYQEGVSKPFMVIAEPIPVSSPESFLGSGLSQAQIDIISSQSMSLRKAFEASTQAYYVTAEKFLHFNFTDLGLDASLGISQDQISPEVDPKLALEIVGDYLNAFFNETLLGERSDLLQKKSPYPNVQFERVGN